MGADTQKDGMQTALTLASPMHPCVREEEEEEGGRRGFWLSLMQSEKRLG